MAYAISVDTGGTFTDVVISKNHNLIAIGKSLTTKERIFSGVKDAILNASGNAGVDIAEIFNETDRIIYGTTHATNAIVTRNTAKTAFLTTKGFPDILLLKEGGKLSAHDFSNDYSAPYIPRINTFEVDERIMFDGAIHRPLDKTNALCLVEEIKRRNFEAVAVCLLWSISNPVHELLFGELLQEHAPNIAVSLSHQLNPVMREYRRASATAIDASLKPLMQKHLRSLEEDLNNVGFDGELYVSTVAGGCNNVSSLIEQPIYMIGSGPAMAPIAGSAFATEEGTKTDLIVCDTGGTTFDVGLVRDGNLTFTRETWLGPKYSGDLLGISAVDVRSVGAGGGSIAWLDDAGLMHVGPQSAGSNPGPACYNQGGEKPTVTDAAVVLGYIDPNYFLGSRMKLNSEAAFAAIQTLADELGVGVQDTAWQILRFASDFMMRAISDITINEGLDPRESTIVAGGGAAGLNIMMIAEELNCSKVILPRVASVLSASGMQFSNIVAEQSASLPTVSSNFSYEKVNTVLAELIDRVERLGTGSRKDRDGTVIELTVEARYESQVWELDTPFTSSIFDGQSSVATLVEAFHKVHERVFAVRDETSDVEFINWKAKLVVPSGINAEQNPEKRDPRSATTDQHRSCFFGLEKEISTPIYRATELLPGHVVSGPAIIEAETTTVVVFPKMSAEVTMSGNFSLLSDNGETK
ncbi:hydantoinase/oxoprolinase family protein [Ruegeria sp. 2012CJ41-6]|uniref:Hydantoinase/oxoprolinase family protein n=1 Tax=Ruegeria spongiae TaxID=2942209 RepID=A0ABT0Q679_9RHOB|nr:hydantoinase/oxoprolinase family protein [Ruegeria spongiae]MCL6285072.1 hydantoinase/oxoprolinase family protein [Ruegeria spongiae]